MRFLTQPGPVAARVAAALVDVFGLFVGSVVGLLTLTAAVQAATWRSVVVPAAVLYDGPSVRANRVGIAPRGMPVEVISTVEPFVKVRDPSGDLQWVQRRALGEQRTVVTTTLATIRIEPRDTAPTAFQAEPGVVLELVDVPRSGPPAGASATPSTTPSASPSAITWVRVRHRDGVVGWVASDQVWGL